MQLDLLHKESRAKAREADSAPVETDEAAMVTTDTLPSHDDEKAPEAFKTISEVASLLNVPQHVLRFWESRFSQVRPLKLRGGRRYYRPEDIDVLSSIHHLLYKQGYTINGAKKVFGQRKQTDTQALPVATVPAAHGKSAAKAGFSDKQRNQLCVVRQELIGLKDILTPYMTEA